MKPPLCVAVTGAAGNIGYALLWRIASGECFGTDQPIRLQLLEITPALGRLDGVMMELSDSAFPLVHEVVGTDDPHVAFKDTDAIFLVGSRPRSADMDRADLVAANGPIFVGQGQAIDAVASRQVKVVTVGNPCNTNCLIAMNSAPDIPDDRFSAMTRLDQNRAQAQLAAKAGVHTSAVKNTLIWGNHSATQVPDFVHATINGKSAAEVINDNDWLTTTFFETVQKRGAAIIAARGLSSAASAANGLIDHVRDLCNATPDGEWRSVCVKSDGSYGVPEGLISSFPVRADGKGGWEIVQGLELTPFLAEKLALSAAELSGERETVSGLLT